MTRRGFFRRTFGAVAAAVLAPLLPKPALHPIVAATSGLFNPTADLAAAYRATRLDCVYGFAALRPDLACRVMDPDPWIEEEPYAEVS